VKKQRYTREDEEKLLRAVNAVRDYPLSVLQHFRNFPVCSPYQIESITKMAQAETELLPSLLAYIVAINLQENNINQKMNSAVSTSVVTQQQMQDMVAMEVVEAIQDVGWAYSAFNDHDQAQPMQDIGVRLVRRATTEAQEELVRKWVRSAWDLGMEGCYQNNSPNLAEAEEVVNAIVEDHLLDAFGLRLRVERTANEQKAWNDVLINRDLVTIDRGVSAVVTQVQMYQKWYSHQTNLTGQKYRSEVRWDNLEAMQRIDRHANFKPVHVATFIDNVLANCTGLEPVSQLRHLAGVQMLMDRKNATVQLNGEERCTCPSELMHSMVKSIHQYHDKTPGAGMYTMEGRWCHTDILVKAMTQSGFQQAEGEDGGFGTFDTLDTLVTGSWVKGMDEMTATDIFEILSGSCMAYTVHGSMVMPKHIDRHATKAFHNAVRSLAWKELDMIIYRIECAKKLLSPSNPSVHQGTRGYSQREAPHTRHRPMNKETRDQGKNVHSQRQLFILTKRGGDETDTSGA
jgi:hypothetical protein